MASCRLNSSIERVVAKGFEFPLGTYPLEPMEPREGFTMHFESADADEGSDPDLERWPDRYVFDIVIRATRVEALTRSLFALLPGRVYPILDVLGNDAYREADPYVAYDLVGQEHFLEAVRRFRAWFYEDGLVGFGAMSDEPFIYVFVDEHKIVTVRAEITLKTRIEGLLAAFDLSEVDRVAGADAAMHEHRGVLDAPEERHDLLCAEEIVEELRDLWGLQLNVDAERNLDEMGHNLGVTPWRCIVRVVEGPGANVRYGEAFLTADSLNVATELTIDAAEDNMATARPALLRGAGKLEDDVSTDVDDETPSIDVLFTDRMSEKDFEAAAPGGTGKNVRLDQSLLVAFRWLE